MSVRWTLPPGFEAGPLEWPAPVRHEEPPLASFVLEGEVLLLATLKVPAGAAPGTKARLEAKVEWLACHEVCIPGEAAVALELPLDAAAPRPSAAAAAFDAARAALPRPGAGWTAAIESHTDSEIALRLAPPRDVELAGRTLYFFAEREGLVEPAKPQPARKLEGGAVRLALPRVPTGRGPLEVVRGVLTIHGGGGPPLAFALEARMQTNPSEGD